MSFARSTYFITFQDKELDPQEFYLFCNKCPTNGLRPFSGSGKSAKKVLKKHLKYHFHEAGGVPKSGSDSGSGPKSGSGVERNSGNIISLHY